MDQLLKELKELEDYLGIQIYPRKVEKLREFSKYDNSEKINAFRARLQVC